MTRIKVVRRVPRRVPIADVYVLAETARGANLGLLHATPTIDVAEIQEGAYQRFIARSKKR